MGRYDRTMHANQRDDTHVIGWAIAFSPIVVAAVALLLGLRVPVVTQSFWPASDTNIVEAAFVRDAARVRVLAAVQSLNQPQPVRPRLLESNDPRVMTPLEAAVRGRSDDVVRIVLELGARPLTNEARRLQCLALEKGVNGAADLLRETFDLPDGSCDQ